MKRTLRIVWQRTQRRLGWMGLLGGALLLAAAAVAAALPGLDAESESLARRLDREHGQARPLLHAPAALTPDRQQVLADFGARLPALADNAADLEKLFGLAQAHKLELFKGDYQLAAAARAPVQTYSVTLPVHQSYAVLKRFSAEVLRALPHAMLDELRMERHDAGSTEVDARVRFTLIYKGE